MRKINTQDAFKAARLIKYSNVKDTLIEYYEKANSLKKLKGKELEKFGMQVAFDIINCLCENKVEKEFYDLLAGICEKTPEQIEMQSINETISDLKLIVKENDMQSFFKFVSGMI